MTGATGATIRPAGSLRQASNKSSEADEHCPPTDDKDPKQGDSDPGWFKRSLDGWESHDDAFLADNHSDSDAYHDCYDWRGGQRRRWGWRQHAAADATPSPVIIIGDHNMI